VLIPMFFYLRPITLMIALCNFVVFGFLERRGYTVPVILQIIRFRPTSILGNPFPITLRDGRADQWRQ